MLKFGGTSVASAARWAGIAEILSHRHAEGYRLMVVCSALSGVTNLLESLADSLPNQQDREPLVTLVESRHEALCSALGLDTATVLGPLFAELRERATDASREPGPATRAELIAMGERMSSTLGRAYLGSLGLDAGYMDARELLRADHPEGAARDVRYYLSAECVYQPNPGLRATLEEEPTHDIVITQGFVARDSEGRTVLLGRGGSDTSAAYLSAILGASRLEIWTDVPGLFSANPRRIDDARLLPRVSYNEARVFAALGAKVLHPRCLQPVIDHDIPVRICWTERPHIVGTIIGGQGSVRSGVHTVSSRTGLLLLSMTRDASWQPIGFMAQVATAFSRHGLSMDLIASSPGDIRVTIDRAASPHIDDVLPALLDDLADFCRPDVVPDVACVSLAGRAVRNDAHRLSEILSRISGPHVHMVTWAADDSHVSFVVSAASALDMVAHVHRELFEVIGEEPADEPLGPSWRSLVHTHPAEERVRP